MFKEINLSEAEFFGNSEAGSSIKFSRVLDWMKNVKSSSNAKFLKCIVNKALKVKVYSVADITFSENLIHKDKTYDIGVKIYYIPPTQYFRFVTVENISVTIIIGKTRFLLVKAFIKILSAPIIFRRENDISIRIGDYYSFLFLRYTA